MTRAHLRSLQHARLLGGALLAICLLALPAPLSAHAPRQPLGIWAGDFSPTDVHCQRAVGYAMGLCLRNAWSARQTCLNAQLNGQSCDEGATDAMTQALREHAAEVINQNCSDPAASQILFFGRAELLSNLSVSCQRLESDIEESVYAPLLASAPSPRLDEPTRACVTVTADVATKLLRFAITNWRRAFDRIAAGHMPPSQQLALAKGADARIAQAETRLLPRITAACSAADFNATYAREASELLRSISLEAYCLAGDAYVQQFAYCQ